MPHRKPFIAGLGSGIVLASLLLQLIRASGAEQAPVPAGIGPDAWKAEAARQGYRVLTESELEAVKKQAAAQERAKIAAETAAPEPSPAADSAVAVQSAPAETPAPSPSLPPGTVRIPGGALAQQAAEALAEAGVIERPEDLVEALRKQYKTTKIRAGTYTFKPGTSIEAIVQAITSD
ncbi:endolytic transglycosylase MltG [Paenibacillus thermoaerophilus]|uniref:Endolytic transglycosylase MltG n=1 Tax=Paenibacillus thermoaerophilus TaxID=1215385 RepID=A0ABW2V3A3_9BACL|nr:endolytic transglycosylase MltG [Paenibacillus thermoaerophilus]TMV13823.1 hypothetical protein FE781_11535 [Paenibacillus thermoaerophilus]